MKAVKTKLSETNPERVEAFEKGAAAFAKKLVANFKDYEFVSRIIYFLLFDYTENCQKYTGESMNPDGMVALLNYRVCPRPLFVQRFANAVIIYRRTVLRVSF